MRNKRLQSQNGFSLAELLVTVFVLSIGISSTLLFFTNTIAALQYARDTTMATSHAEHILEEMKTRSSLSNITTTDWETWFNSESLDALPNEAVSVAFADSSADPLEVTATVNWTRNERDNTVNLTTEMTK